MPIHFKIVDGIFIMELSEKLAHLNQFPIQENAVIHRNCTSGNRLHEMVYLPPNSPFKNPIKCVFSKLKKYSEKTSMDEIVNEYKLNYIKGLTQEEINSHEYDNLRPYFRHLSKFFIDIVQKYEIFGV